MMNVFKELSFHPMVEKWFASTFEAVSPPQIMGWPSIAGGNHTLILAPTGSGKTLAAFLWSVDQLFRLDLQKKSDSFEANAEGVHTLYISPLKALNNDIERNLQTPLKGITAQAERSGIEAPRIRVAVRSGDTPSHLRQAMLRQPPHILITTPESLYLILTSPVGRGLFRNLRYVIVDEIHALSNSKRGVHLSLSLERLMPLCAEQPIRIGLSATQKPLDRIAAFLGGLDFRNDEPAPRKVNIIDCGQRKEMDLRVISPVKNFEELPEASVWKPVYEKLYQLILEHRTTLIFANMRAQTEKIARQLNELHRQISGDPEAIIALAHHGSISREARFEVEEKLKNGQIPAVVATASLELGIDIGSIDLVVQLEAPRSVSGGLQRIGRSGHLLSAKSKGRIIPLYPSDLDDGLAITRCMFAGEIEETIVPENALDVLAQQIVAEVSMQKWSFDALFRLVRQSYCYRNLSETLFRSVVEMLSGKYSDQPIKYLRASLQWDRINNQLIARRGSRLLAVLNGGVIPDRGYFGVYLKDGNIRLGEVEEEFVHESRVGEAFFLGNSEWRIDSITQDRIIVTPIAAIKPKAPFWKGGLLFRDFSTSLKIAQFRSELIEKMQHNKAQDWLKENFAADDETIDNLIRYFEKQRRVTPVVATDSQIVVERCADSGGLPVLIIHAPFGARVNGLWAVVLIAAMEMMTGIQAQYSFDENGILLRVAEQGDIVLPENLLRISLLEAEKLLIGALQDTPAFAIQFRHIAACALLLPRSQTNNRIPLWLQRLRSADLLQAVRKFQDFPLIIETFRNLLYDVFDLVSFKEVITRINNGQMAIHFVQTLFPSPMASGILFKFVSTAIYEYDQSRRTGGQISPRGELLAEILDREEPPAFLTTGMILQAEQRWQHLSLAQQAKDQEDLFAIIEKLAPIETDELQKRSLLPVHAWLDQLLKEKRIVCLASSFHGWISAADQSLFTGIKDAGRIKEWIRRFLRAHGPLQLTDIQARFPVSDKEIMESLEHLLHERVIVRGRLIEGSDDIFWCDRSNFAELYQRAIAQRRDVQQPADRSVFYRFLLGWHHVNEPLQPLLPLLEQYCGLRFPLNFFEREILSSRAGFQEVIPFDEKIDELRGLIADGQVFVLSGRNDSDSREWVSFIPHGQGNLFLDRKRWGIVAKQVTPESRDIFKFLHENGASHRRDLTLALGKSDFEIQKALSELILEGLVSCDDFQAWKITLADKSFTSQEDKEMIPPAIKSDFIWRENRAAGRASRSSIKQTVQRRLMAREGRWFLTTSFAMSGKQLTESERAEKQARLLLQRYGILIKEWYRREEGLLPWHQLFQVLKRLEWQGEIRRGYFVQVLSGIQFALPEALDLLEKLQLGAQQPDKAALLCVADPVLPFGGNIPWNLCDSCGNELTVTRLTSNHLIFLNGEPCVYSEQYGIRLWFLKVTTETETETIIGLLKNWLRLPDALRLRKRLEIEEINGKPAITFAHAAQFIANGFEADGTRLILWPSAL